METILRKALKKADSAEVFYSTAEEVLARHSLNCLEACKSSVASGYGLRVIRNGRMGFAYFAKEHDADNAISDALRIARLSPKENITFPSRSKHKTLRTSDKRVASMNEEDVVELTLDLIDGASDHASPVKGEVSATQSYVHVMNSEGVDVDSKDTVFSCYSEAKKGKSMSFDERSSSRFVEVRPVAEKAGLWAKRGFGGKPVGFKGRVCLGVDVLEGFFSSAVLPQFNGESARRGKTQWGKMVGRKVVDSSITVTEDPFVPWARASASLDDEGLPTKKKTLIARGVMKRHLYDVRSAVLSNKKPTGNGFRGSHDSPPEISLTNIIVSSSRKTNVMNESGLFVRSLMGYHNMNPVTGDFALTITEGFVLDGGVLGKPIHGSVLRGNIFSALHDDPLFDKKLVTRDWFTSPSMSFDAEVVK